MANLTDWAGIACHSRARDGFWCGKNTVSPLLNYQFPRCHRFLYNFTSFVSFDMDFRLTDFQFNHDFLAPKPSPMKVREHPKVLISFCFPNRKNPSKLGVILRSRDPYGFKKNPWRGQWRNTFLVGRCR